MLLGDKHHAGSYQGGRWCVCVFRTAHRQDGIMEQRQSRTSEDHYVVPACANEEGDNKLK